MQKPKIIAIVGPTASGKSALGAYLAKKLNGEIISADSRQIYKGMKIISRAQPGHMVGFVNPKHPYSAGQYAKDAAKVCSNVLQNDRMIIVVGGTGFYADALLRTPLPEVAPNRRLRALLSKKSSQQLLVMLKKLDAKSAARVDPKNTLRLIRAIEIAKALGKVPPLSRTTRYEVLWLGFPMVKNYESTLRKGVAERLKKGMLAEARKLRHTLPPKRFLALGFEFTLLAKYLDKRITKRELAEALVRGERKYAKRQMRWFRRNKQIRWVSGKSKAFRLAKNFLSR